MNPLGSSSIREAFTVSFIRSAVFARWLRSKNLTGSHNNGTVLAVIEILGPRFSTSHILGTQAMVLSKSFYVVLRNTQPSWYPSRSASRFEDVDSIRRKSSTSATVLGHLMISLAISFSYYDLRIWLETASNLTWMGSRQMISSL